MLYKQLIKTKSTSPSYSTKKEKLHQHKILLKKLLKKTKKDYYTTQFTKFSNDCKNTWKLLNQVAGRKSLKRSLPNSFKLKIEGPREEHATEDMLELEITGDKAIADEFNMFFSQIGSELSQKITYTGKKLSKSPNRLKIHIQFSIRPRHNGPHRDSNSEKQQWV